jgi:RimJ/RimL family protein N-acetyltransferase
VGELYYIEAKENGTYVSIGDVTVKDKNPPIAIWVDAYSGKGIGKLVMQTVITRLKEMGFAKITGSTVYQWNTASQKLHESLGFHRVSEDEKEITYEREL